MNVNEDCLMMAVYWQFLFYCSVDLLRKICHNAVPKQYSEQNDVIQGGRKSRKSEMYFNFSHFIELYVRLIFTNILKRIKMTMESSH